MVDGEKDEEIKKEGLSLSRELPKDEPSPNLHGDEAGIIVQKGPFESYPLIENLASNLEYVQFEASDENIYLGTSSGDLLHYFEIEPRNYMLVSQTQFDSGSTAQIKKIILLPKIERALVLCGEQLVLFLLPEFAPVPNTIKLKGVTDIALRSHSESSNSYKFYATQKDSIKLYKVSTNVLTLSGSYKFNSVTTIVAQGHHLAVAKQNSYEILNLKTSGVTPLFRVSELNAPLQPIIADFSDSRFLVATGGESYSDSSMALVVNHEGDMVNGTIILENYPREVLIEYPYLIVNYGYTRVVIYQLGDDSKVVQEIKIDKPSLRIAKTTKVFSGFRRPEVKERVVEKLRMVPLIHEENQLKLDNERVSVEELYEERSSIAIYGHFGIHVLIKNSPILELSQYNESDISNIEKYLKEIPKSELPKFRRLENKFLMTLRLLLLLLHCEDIGEAVLKEWCASADTVDIRVLLYILNFEVYGNVWIYKGLQELTEQLKSLKLVHKCIDVRQSLRMISNTFRFSRSRVASAELELITKSLDVSIFKLELEKNPSEIDITFFSESSLEEIAHIIESQKTLNLDLYLKVNQRTGKLMECIKILKSRGEVNRLLQFIDENATNLPTSYKDVLLDDILYIIGASSEVDENLISRILNLLSQLSMNPRELMTRVSDNPTVKVLLIQQLGPANAQDKKFLVEYYMAKIEECFKEKELWKLLQKFASDYRQDMTYTKCSTKEFLIIKLRSDSRCEELFRFYETLEAVNGLEKDDTLTASLLDIAKTFDKDNLLTLLFLPDGDSANQFMTKEVLLAIYLELNDFTSIERCLTSENILQVLAHYTSFKKIQHSLNLVAKLLQRNLNLIRSKETVRSVLKILPPEFALSALFDFLFCVLKRLDGEAKDLELRKAILKDEILISNRLLAKFDRK